MNRSTANKRHGTFPILRLPTRALFSVLRIMESIDRLSFSLCSTVTKESVKSLNLKLSDFKVIFYRDNFNFKLTTEDGTIMKISPEKEREKFQIRNPIKFRLEALSGGWLRLDTTRMEIENLFFENFNEDDEGGVGNLEDEDFDGNFEIRDEDNQILRLAFQNHAEDVDDVDSEDVIFGPADFQRERWNHLDVQVQEMEVMEQDEDSEDSENSEEVNIENIDFDNLENPDDADEGDFEDSEDVNSEKPHSEVAEVSDDVNSDDVEDSEEVNREEMDLETPADAQDSEDANIEEMHSEDFLNSYGLESEDDDDSVNEYSEELDFDHPEGVNLENVFHIQDFQDHPHPFDEDIRQEPLPGPPGFNYSNLNFKNLISHCLEIYQQSSINTVQILNGTSRFDFEILQEFFKFFNFQGLTLEITNRPEFEFSRKVLEIRKNFNKLSINPQVLTGHFLQDLLIQNFEFLNFSKNSKSFEIDDLLMLNSPNFAISNAKFSNRDLNRFIKNWIRNGKIEFFKFKFGIREPFEKDQIFKGIDFQEIPEGYERKRMIITENGEKVKIVNNGFNIRRRDGKEATVILNEDDNTLTFEFLVWN